MSENGDMTRNVGTANYPVTALHERAVALLYDELTRPDLEREEEIQARLSPGGDLSHDLRAGVAKVKVPDPEWDSVGGIVPDLILYGDDDTRPLRIIEVVVTNPPNDEKRQKLDALRKRGVDVVVINVKEESDLPNLCPTWWKPRFGSVTTRDTFSINYSKDAYMQGQIQTYDRKIWDLIEAIQGCSPATRRALLKLLSELKTLNSLYPIRPTNPLKDKLSVTSTNDGKSEPTNSKRRN